MLVTGTQELDFEELAKATEYDGGFGKDHPTIVAFWAAVADMPPEEQRRLLMFVTGSKKVTEGSSSIPHGSYPIRRWTGEDFPRIFSLHASGEGALVSMLNALLGSEIQKPCRLLPSVSQRVCCCGKRGRSCSQCAMPSISPLMVNWAHLTLEGQHIFLPCFRFFSAVVSARRLTRYGVVRFLFNSLRPYRTP